MTRNRVPLTEPSPGASEGCEGRSVLSRTTFPQDPPVNMPGEGAVCGTVIPDDDWLRMAGGR